MHFGAEEPWSHLVGLTNLKQLTLRVAASGDPSPMSALTGLSSLELCSRNRAVLDGWFNPCTFSSLQALSTLQQLKELVLEDKACSATSLHGLAELSRLAKLTLAAPMLKSLEGVSTGLTYLVIRDASELDSLAGIEQLQGLQDLCLTRPGVSSLHGLAALGNLRELCIGGTFASLAGLEGSLCTSLRTLTLESCWQLRHLSGLEGLNALEGLMMIGCGVTSLQLAGGLKALLVMECRVVQEEVLELLHIQPTADVSIESSNVKEVMLAGGVRRRVDG